ncbi:MAG: polymerase [Desulfuromonadales bacterium]|nr:polymerase [Desulfuromonadales bacterium]
MGGGGPKTDQRLRAMGVVTIGDLAALPPGSLIARFGRSHGSWLYQAAREVDATPQVRFRPPDVKRRPDVRIIQIDHHNRDCLAKELVEKIAAMITT